MLKAYLIYSFLFTWFVFKGDEIEINATLKGYLLTLLFGGIWFLLILLLAFIIALIKKRKISLKKEFEDMKKNKEIKEKGYFYQEK